MHNNVIILASSSPDPEKSNTPQPITILSSPTYTVTPCPSTRHIDPLLRDTRSPVSIPSFGHQPEERKPPSFFEDELPELTLPVYSAPPFSQTYPSTSISVPSSSQSSQTYSDIFLSFSQPEPSLPEITKHAARTRKLLRKVKETGVEMDKRNRKKLQKTQELRKKKSRIQVNRTRSKLECAQELVFSFHPFFEKEFEGKEDLFSKLKESKIQYKFDDLVPPFSITCKRYSDRIFNSELHVWEPLEEPVPMPENWIASFFSLENFRQMASKDPDAVLSNLKGYKRAILVVEGCTLLSRTRKINETDETWFELMHDWRIQMGINILETKTRSETVLLLHSLFCELGAMPYLRCIYQDSLYFTEINVKSGIGLTDTWRQFLMCIRQMTEPVANAIIQRYPTFQCLYKAYISDPHKAPLLLEDIMVNRENKSKRLGPTLSKRFHAIFMSKDPYYEPYA